MSLPPPLPPKSKSLNDWRAVLVTLAFPGMGQFLQGRKIVAYVLTTITTLSLLWGVSAIVYGGFEGFRESLSTGSTTTDLFAGFRYARSPLRALGWCYLVSFLDAVIAHFILTSKRGN